MVKGVGNKVAFSVSLNLVLSNVPKKGFSDSPDIVSTANGVPLIFGFPSFVFLFFDCP